MYDAALYYRDRARGKSDILERFGIKTGGFVLATCHRAENTDDPNRLREICLGLEDIASMLPVIFPVHPRTRAALLEHRLEPCLTRVTLLDPLTFLEIVALEQAAKAIITDSGGMQREAFFYNVPCITMRDETEWVETVTAGGNRLSGASREKIVSAYLSSSDQSITQLDSPFGDGFASNQIVSILSTAFS
jgi:UDP-GlcNAc3NAcA epimerase